MDKDLSTITLIIADGLDAAVDGRGWDITHEQAKNLANAAPKMREACLLVVEWYDLIKQNYPDMGGLLRGMETALVALAEADGVAPKKTLRAMALEVLQKRHSAPGWQIARELGFDLWEGMRLDSELKVMAREGILRTHPCGGVDSYEVV